MRNENLKRRLSKILPVLLLPLAATPLLSSPIGLVAVTTDVHAVRPSASPENADPSKPPVEVNAVPIAYLIDLSSGQVLYAKEADRRFLPASTTKVMTLYTAFEMLSHKQINTAQAFTMSEEAYKKWHRVGSTMFLDRSMSPTVNDLLLGIANISANDACVVLAEGAAGSVQTWVALMNAEAGRLGMKDSHFGTPNGWMDDGNTYVTARDLATLAAAILAEHPADYHRYIGHETLTWNGITQHNHDPILGKLEGADGIKTGFTNQAGYNFLGSAERHGRRLVMVIAGADRPTDRAKAAKALMDWGFAAFSSKPLFKPGQEIGEAEVQDGQSRHVPLVTPEGFAASLPKDGKGDPSLKIVYNGPLEAPIAKGSMVAQLEIRIGSGPAHRVPLIAGESVGRATAWQRLRNGLFGLVS